jgi:hypothetical protein
MHAIIVTGFPGAGKTSLSHYYHYDYDFELAKAGWQKNNMFKMPNFVIFDAVHFNTERLNLTFNFFKNENYHIDLIWLNTDKQICKENIKRRVRPTINLEPLDVWYDITILREKYIFGLIKVDNLSEISCENYRGPLNIMCENYLKEYEI